MRIHQNTFTGGLDTDTSVNKYDNTRMFRSENFRLLSGDRANSSQAISSIEYNKEVIRLEEPNVPVVNSTIIGLAEIDSSLIIFAHDSQRVLTYIIVVPLDHIDPEQVLVIHTPNSGYIKLAKNFGYTEDTVLKVIATRETSHIKKVYFTDRKSEIFHVNLEDEEIQNYDINKFRLIPHTEFSVIKNLQLISGQLKTGRVQYSYQYYNLNGSETLFAPLSSFINTTTSSQSSQVRKYHGSDIGETTNNGVRFTISDPVREFDRIRLVRILYEEFQAEPAIQVFQETIIPSEGDITITDRGTQVLEEMASEEFAELLLDVMPKTWETKNSYLFVGNTKEEPFDFGFDSRAVRYKSNQSNNYTEYHDLKNPFNLLEKDGNSSYEYRYHETLKTTEDQPVLGGTGENIEYWFRTKKLLIDQGEDLGQPYIKQLNAQDGSYANWENAAKYVGYQRDEIYRFGLVGYNEQGQASFVKWIDDIRMPDFKDGIEEFEVEDLTPIDEKFAYKFMSIKVPLHEENIMDVTLRFGKEGVSESFRIILAEDQSFPGVIDVDTVKEQFNQNKPFGTLKMVDISYSEVANEEVLLVRIEDTAVNGGFSITYSFNQCPVGNPTFTVLDSGDYQAPSSSGGTQLVENNYNLLSIEEEEGITSIYANILYPVFKVENLPPEIVSYQIVRVERDRENRTVIDLGILSSLVNFEEEDNTYYFRSIPRLMDGNFLFEYTSPEHLVNNLEGVQGSRLETISLLGLEDVGQMWGFADGLGEYIDNANYLQHTIFPSSYEQLQKYNITASRDYSYIQDIDATYNFEGQKILNIVAASPDIQFLFAVKGSTKLFTLQGSPVATHGALSRRRIETYPYGGISQSSLKNSTYISTGTYTNKQNSVVETFGGDVYIGYFNYLRGLFPGINWSHGFVVRALNFPVESTINPELLVSKDFNSLTIKQIVDTERDRVVLAIQEEAGAHEYFDEEIFEQDFNLYTYNSAYSQPKSLQRFFPKPKDFKEEVEWPNRIYYSDKKTLGEAADSWLKFRPGNFMDLDTKYGAIKALVSFKDNLFCFQEKGISILGVEQRELTQTDSPGPLVVGTGETLTQPYYISTSSGISDYRHVTQSRNVVYFYDSLNKKVGRIVENGVEFLSDSKSIKFLMKEEWSEVYASYNPHYNEILFSYNGDKSLVFNEYLDTFSGVYTHSHSDSILGDHGYFTINRNEAPNRLFKDSISKSDTIYNKTPEESVITLVINPTGNIVSLYDILELTLEVYDQESELKPNECVSAIRCYNEWQDTGRMELVPEENIIQRFRTWRMNALVDSTEDEGRLRSSSLFVDIYFDKNQSRKLVLHDVLTKYRSNIPSQQENQ